MKNVLLFLGFVVATGCEKKKEEADTLAPVITMSSPSQNQVFAAGQTVNITGTISDNKKLGRVHLEIINTATGAFIMHEHYTPGAASYNLSKTFITQAATSYKLKVEAEDGAGNAAKTEIVVSSN